MPEIVELKVFAKSLSDSLAGREVTSANYAKGFDISFVVGKRLSVVAAHGKELFFFFDGDPAFSAHLMLSGGFNILNRNLRPAAVDTVAEIVFENEIFLMLFDPDGYAKIAPFTDFPPVPEATAIDRESFLRLLARKKGSAVKNILLDQKCVRGIGNAYADEILYAARINPAVKAGNIPFEAQNELYDAMTDTLNSSIEYYMRRYKGATHGEMRDRVQVHTRARFTPGGEIIHVTDLSGKKTYFTDSQRKFD